MTRAAMQPVLATVLGALAVAAAAASAASLFLASAGVGLDTVVAGHLAGTAFACASAGARPGVSAVRRRAVLVTALCIPVLGPALAWTLVLGDPTTSGVNAHAEFERAAAGGPSPPGEPDGGEGRSASVVSYALVLRDGSLDHKRNLLRKLAELGGPKHLAVLRRCLDDPEMEVRLCAYGELQQLGGRCEARIAALQRAAAEVEGRSGEADALCALAEAELAYAQSGILDDDMARYWTWRGAASAGRALDAAPDHARVTTVRAVAQARLGELCEAAACIERIGAADLPEVVVARCEIAFRRHDFAAVRRGAAALRSSGVAIPAWIAAFDGDERELATADAAGAEAGR